MKLEAMPTKFAPAERAPIGEVNAQRDVITAVPIIKQILDAMPSMVLVLNKHRQILHANKALLNFLHTDEVDCLIGSRPGEALKCKYAHEAPGGCGTCAQCSSCGAAHAILTALQGSFQMMECKIIRDKSGDQDALDLRIIANPAKIVGMDIIILSIQDIGDEKRRNLLERIFFHDVLNSAGALAGLLDSLSDAPVEEIRDYWDTILALSNSIVDEIKAQRELIAAENGELMLSIQKIDAQSLVQRVASHYASVSESKRKKLQISAKNSLVFESDFVILSRIIGNMLKNALEADAGDNIITLGYESSGGDVVFHVTNRSHMSQDVQCRVFQRSFSTKGKNRGLGTYSIKLLCERYLGGRVWFKSNEQEGTTFFAAVPIKGTLPEQSNRLHKIIDSKLGDIL